MKLTQVASALILLTFLGGAAAPSGAASQPEIFTYPAEFEPQSAVWLGAALRQNGQNDLPVLMAMVRALAPNVALYLVSPDFAQQQQLKSALRKAGLDERRIRYVIVRSSPTRWYRDIGPVFLKGNRGHLKVVDFSFNCYGDCANGSAEAMKKEGIDRQIAAMLRLPVLHTRLASEGGDRDVNGQGTLMAVESVEMQRNPHLTRAQIEHELLRVLGQKKMIWLKRGVAEDDDAQQQGPVSGNIYAAGAGGHIDEMARFTDPHTILLEQVTAQERDSDPVLRASYKRLGENYRILTSATDQDGRPFRIVRMPAADPIYLAYTFKAGDDGLAFFRGSKPGQPIRVILPASYMNFVISNGVVLVSAYWRPGRPESTRRKDEAARRILQSLFPDRRIVQIHDEAIHYGGGGMHCATQQMPALP